MAEQGEDRGIPMSIWLLLIAGIISGIATTLVTWLAIRAEKERAQELPLLLKREPGEKVEI